MYLGDKIFSVIFILIIYIIWHFTLKCLLFSKQINLMNGATSSSQSKMQKKPTYSCFTQLGLDLWDGKKNVARAAYFLAREG